MTAEQREKLINANPRLKRFQESGDCERVSRLLAMMYLLHTICYTYHEEAEEILSRNGLNHFRVKHSINHLKGAFDLFLNEIKGMVPGDEEKLAFCDDSEIMMEVCDEFMKPGGIEIKRGDYYHATMFLPKKKKITTNNT